MRTSLLPLSLLALLACGPAKLSVEDTGAEGGGGEDTDTGSVSDGAISVSPASVELPLLFVGQTGTAPLTVTNIGSDEVSVTVSILGGHADAWTLDAYTSAPGPGESATHTASLTPTAWGDFSVSLIFEDAISGGKVEVPVTARVQEDADHDGYGSVGSGGEDCNDGDAAINPGATEVWYDGVDSDCDGAADDDQDADGVGVDEDCNDTDATVHPGATDTWYDGVDSDCAGNDDYDQDGDGYTDASGGGDDCDDTNADIHPGAADAWYDGVDTNCDGANDQDQDGDGVEVGADCDDTDASAYPGATEIWYDGVDQACDGGNDHDQDGDGVEYPTDCNDTDPTVTGPMPEGGYGVDGIDNDCNGYVDDFTVSDLAAGILYGTAASMGLGDHGGIAGTTDITGDGLDDLVLAANGSGYGYAWVVEGADAVAANGLVTDSDTATITGNSYYYPLRYVNGPFADATGDGQNDLLVGGKYNSYYYGEVYGFEGGSGLSGALSVSNADATFVGDSDSYADDTALGATVDLNGDGLAETVVGSDYDNSDDRDAGSIAIFTTFSGEEDIGDAEDRIYGADAYDYFGGSLTTADLDGDGYGDIVAGAAGYDEGANDGGGVFVIPGNASLAWDDVAPDAAGFEIQGDTNSLALGQDSLAHPGDVDGDGNLDLGLTSEASGRAWLFTNASARSGQYAVSDADVIISGTAGDLGSSLTLDSDLDGDGADDLVVGADGDDTAFSNAGATFIFFGSGSLAATLVGTDADVTLWGTAADEYFGSGSGGGVDLDGDGREDVVIGAVSNDVQASGAGAAYVIKGW